MPRDGRKLGALPEEMMDRIWKQSLPVLIEADGARRMPLKVPAGHEPVIDPRTTHVVSLYGLDSLGQRFEDVCFRPTGGSSVEKREERMRYRGGSGRACRVERGGEKGVPGRSSVHGDFK